MKKNLLTILILSCLLYPYRSEAILPLPPFKFDASVVGNEFISSSNTVANTSEKTTQQSSHIKWQKMIGQGAKEQFEFYKKMLEQFKGMDFNDPTSILIKIREMEAKEGKAKTEAAENIANRSQEANKKIAEIDKNIRELNKKIISDAENTKKYQKKIQKYEKEKDRISKELVKSTRKINVDVDSKVSNLRNSIKKLTKDLDKGLGELADSLKKIPADYKSTEDLNQSLDSLIPTAGKEINTHTISATKIQHRKKYYEVLKTVPSVAVRTKIGIEADNQKAEETQAAVKNLETSSGAVGGLVSLKIQNIQATLTYTELLLQRVRYDVAKDLINMKVEEIDPKQSVADFNLDNYKFIPPAQTETDSKADRQDKKEKELKKLDEKIVPNSGIIITEGYTNIKNSAQADKAETIQEGSKKDDKE